MPRGVDDLGSRQLVFELADAGLDVALLVLGRVVLGVFLQVAMCAGDLDFLGDFVAVRGLQALQLVVEPVVACLGHRDSLFHLQLPQFAL